MGGGTLCQCRSVNFVDILCRSLYIHSMITKTTKDAELVDQVTVLLPRPIRIEIDRRAAESRRSRSAEIVILLEEILEAKTNGQ